MMTLSPELKAFIFKHLKDDPEKLLLTASRYPQLDIRFAAAQIQARQQIREKLPSWYANPNLLFPSRLSTEQCSSELTALYKQRLMQGKRFCDLTGGLGIDCFYLSQQAETACYIERFPDYCEAARHNFSVLGARNIEIHPADCRELAPALHADTFYADPARRATGNRRVYALTDCEPDILRLKAMLLQQSTRLIVKLSPMADLEETIRLLPETREIHILSVRNECKELLFVLKNGIPLSPGQIRIHAVDLHPVLPPQEFTFCMQEEKEACLQTTSRPETYLYEPHAALLKSGAFKLTANRLGIQKLHRHSHLYTSASWKQDFPGRSFIREEVYAFSGKLLKTIGKQIPQANISTRNFPLTVAELRKRSGIKEGGDQYLFATTLADDQRVLILTRKAEAPVSPGNLHS